MLTWEYQLLPLAKRKVSSSLFVNEWQYNGWIYIHDHLLRDQATAGVTFQNAQLSALAQNFLIFVNFRKLILLQNKLKCFTVLSTFHLTLWTVSRVRSARNFRTVHYRSTWALTPVKGSRLLHSCFPCGIPTQSQTSIQIRSAAKLLT